MPRKLFDREINDLIHRMTDLGNDVDGRIQMTIDALRTLDIEKAKKVATSDNEIDSEEHRIEQICMNLIALQQPIASDLRTIAACLKILTDMEREADQCADICDILTIAELDRSSLALAHVVQMLEAAHEMFRGALDVFLSRDVEAARKVCQADDNVDAMFSKIVLEVCGSITESPQTVMCDVDLIFITKYVARMADHATKSAEWVIYMETDEHPDLNTKVF